MAKRKAKHRILVVRDGEQIAVEPDTSFDFTAEEVKDFDKSGALYSNDKPAAKVADKPAAKAADKPAAAGK